MSVFLLALKFCNCSLYFHPIFFSFLLWISIQWRCNSLISLTCFKMQILIQHIPILFAPSSSTFCLFLPCWVFLFLFRQILTTCLSVWQQLLSYEAISFSAVFITGDFTCRFLQCHHVFSLPSFCSIGSFSSAPAAHVTFQMPRSLKLRRLLQCSPPASSLDSHFPLRRYFSGVLPRKTPPTPTTAAYFGTLKGFIL
jgi:hypothetical protein